MIFDAYVKKNALEKAVAHCKKNAQNGLEAIGLLMGDVFSWEGKQYVLIEEAITARNVASSVHVRFDREAFGELAKKVSARRGKIIASWYHSHPSMGCFLSGTDVATQKNYFPEKWRVALVMDPLSGEKKFFKLSNSSKRPGYEEASYAVVE